MRTNYYLTRREIKVTDDFKLEKHEKVLGSEPDSEGMVTLLTRYWFKAPRKALVRLENFTK